MDRVAETALTLGGFIALASLGLAAFGFAWSAFGRSSETRERIAKLEAEVEAHMRNGVRHER